MVSLTFYGGAGEVGGNKVLLEDRGARIYLDFGESFDFGKDYFYDFLQPRAANGLEVYFEFSMLQRIPKLYGKKLLERTGLKWEKPDIDAVFISHSHSDHVNHLQFLDESIPVYMGHGTHKILETYHALYSQLVNIGEHEKIIHFKSGEKIKVKHLEIEPVHVEHSIPGAYGFIVKTSRGNLVYTGDFRLHGPMSEYSREFIKKAREAKPCALLIEGTRAGSESEHNYTEKEVEEKVGEIVKSSKGLIFAYFSMSNVDRFMSFYRAAIKNKRKLVIDPKFAYILDNLREKVGALPDVLNDENIRVYFRLGKNGSCDPYYKYEHKYVEKRITFEEVKKSQMKYLMHMSFNKLMELVYIQPKNADYIYSSSEHFLEGEENQDEKRVLENWMRHFKVNFHKAHCSGHASKKDLEETIKEINPEIVIPMHTENPEVFREFHKNVKIPEMGTRMEI